MTFPNLSTCYIFYGWNLPQALRDNITQVKKFVVWDIAVGVTGFRGNDTESEVSYLVDD